MHYNEVLSFVMDEHVIKSRSAVTTILRDLTRYGLLDRVVQPDRPPRTKYSINEKGVKMLKRLGRSCHAGSENRD